MQKAYKKYFWLFLMPTLIAFTVFFIIPFVLGIGLSFCKFTTISNAKFIGIGNYIKAFSNPDFIDAFIFTVKFTLVSVITVNIFAFSLAYILTRGIKGTNLYRTVFFMPNLIGGIVLGYMMIIYIAGIQNIPGELVEASKIDGANKVQSLFKITIPMIMSSITICLFLTLTNSFKLFDQNLALTAGGPGKQTAMLALDINNTFYNRNGWEGVGQAKAVMFFIIVGIIALVQLYFTRKKEVES